LKGKGSLKTKPNERQEKIGGRASAEELLTRKVFFSPSRGARRLRSLNTTEGEGKGISLERTEESRATETKFWDARRSIEGVEKCFFLGIFCTEGER